MSIYDNETRIDQLIEAVKGLEERVLKLEREQDCREAWVVSNVSVNKNNRDGAK